jgi:hypothetical protein
VFLALMAVVQVVLVARDQVAVVHAAREGARAAAVGGVSAGSPAAHAALGLDGEASVQASQSGERVTVVVTYRSTTDVPLIGALVGDITLTGAATMLAEP